MTDASVGLTSLWSDVLAESSQRRLPISTLFTETIECRGTEVAIMSRNWLEAACLD